MTLPREILFIQYTDPLYLPVLIRAGHLFQQAGFAVKYFGIRNKSVPPLEASPEISAHIHYLEELDPKRGTWLTYCAFLWRVIGRLINDRPSLLYVSDPIAAPVGFLLTCLFKIPVVFHEHDAPPEDGRKVSRRVFLWFRGRLLLKAALCVAPNQERASRLLPLGIRTRCHPRVYNAPLRSEIAALREMGKSQTDPVRLYYHGSISAVRVPLTLIAALADLPGAELVVAGYETEAGYLDRLTQEAEARGIAKRLFLLGTVSRHDDLLAHAARSTIGLSLMPMHTTDFNEKSMAGASQKAFEYLAAGSPLLVTARREWIEMFVDRGVAVACDPDDASSISEAIRTVIADRAEYMAMCARGLRLLEAEWNYDTLFAPVVQDVKGLISGE